MGESGLCGDPAPQVGVEDLVDLYLGNHESVFEGREAGKKLGEKVDRLVSSAL